MTRGIARRFREEVVLAGLPLFTRSEGHNYYCPECGARELSVSGSGAETNTAVVEPGDGEKSAGSDPERERDGPVDVERDSA